MDSIFLTLSCLKLDLMIDIKNHRHIKQALKFFLYLISSYYDY